MHIATLILSLAGSAIANDSVRTPTDYRIGTGDLVNIVVHGHERDFAENQFVVGGNGQVSFPYIGMVSVAGLTPFEAEKALRDELMDGWILDPQVTVSVQDFNSQTVDLIGAVKNPGVYNLEGRTTVRSLLAKAGGIVEGQSSGYVAVTRDQETIRLALKDLEGEAGDFEVDASDVVDVEKGTSIYLAGEVAQPGAIPFIEGITASQALLQAGGGTDFGRLAGAYVVRGSERIDVNLKRVLKGKDSDLALLPGDRVVIPVSPL